MDYTYTIIIPHYNTPELLERCLQSIPERDDVQIVVVDDNSPGVSSYFEKYSFLSRKNLTFVVCTDGLGAGHVRNIALNYARGKWILFSDSDDFFSNQLNIILDAVADDSSDVIYYNMKRCLCDDSSKLIEGSFDSLFSMYEEKKDKRIFAICHPMPWGKFIKRQLIIDNNIKFQETRANNDFLFSVKVGLLANTIRAVNDDLYWYTYREGSLSNGIGLEPINKEKDRMRAFYAVQKFLDDQHIKVDGYVPFILINKHIFRHPKRYLELIKFMIAEKMPVTPLFLQTIKWLFRKIVNRNYNCGLETLIS